MKKIFPYTLCALVALLMFSCEPLIKPQHHFSVLFDANGGDGDMDAQILAEGVIDHLAESGFKREGYTFAGWNTAPDGSGTAYTDGQEITLTEDVTLYAQWFVFTPTYVDLGLSVKWATCNIGATAPEGYGDYFAWGETSPKDNYDWSTYKYYNESSSTLTKYNTSIYRGTIDNKTTLDLSDDAARANWGGAWRMPTYAELDELLTNCTWTWTTQNGINGCKVTSKTNGNSIFLPAAGYRNGTSVYLVGSYGYYWSSLLNEGDPSYAYFLYFYSGGVDWYGNSRGCGHTVRAVFSDDTPQTTIYTLTFNANGGQGEMPAQQFAIGESQAIMSNAFTRAGYTFIGWNTSPDGSGTSYTDSQELTLTQDVTLYAQWEVIATTGIENGYEWVDLDLPSGLKWATCNIGATSPEDYGDYFAWGETSPKSSYGQYSHKYCKGSEMALTKYCTDAAYGYNGFTDNKTTLELEDDAAYMNWGGNWRMPTNAEQEELMNNCRWTWTIQNGTYGHKVVSKNNGNSIFIPAIGYHDASATYYFGSYGYYWSRSLYEINSSRACFLSTNTNGVKLKNLYRGLGLPVRAVCP